MVGALLHYHRNRERGHSAWVQNHHHGVRASNSLRVRRAANVSISKEVRCRRSDYFDGYRATVELDTILINE